MGQTGKRTTLIQAQQVQNIYLFLRGLRFLCSQLSALLPCMRQSLMRRTKLPHVTVGDLAFCSAALYLCCGCTCLLLDWTSSSSMQTDTKKEASRTLSSGDPSVETLSISRLWVHVESRRVLCA